MPTQFEVTQVSYALAQLKPPLCCVSLRSWCPWGSLKCHSHSESYTDRYREESRNLQGLLCSKKGCFIVVADRNGVFGIWRKHKFFNPVTSVGGICPAWITHLSPQLRTLTFVIPQPQPSPSLQLVLVSTSFIHLTFAHFPSEALFLQCRNSVVCSCLWSSNFLLTHSHTETT